MPESLGVNTARREGFISETRLPAIVPSLLAFLRFAGKSCARSAGLEPATFSVRSQDTCVYSCLRLLQNCLSKPTCRFRCLQLFTRVTVKSLSIAVASDE